MNVDERKYRILKALIDDYIMTAAPVGSRTISRKSDVGFSPATIRNEMSDLEELGYLAHIHTSSGRIPSHKAYRLYVDQLMQVEPLTAPESEAIRNHFTTRAVQVNDLVREAARVLSDVTHYTSIVTAPKSVSLRLERLQIVPVSAGVGMLIIVTDSGIVRDCMIRYSDALEPDHLYMISKALTEQLHGLPVSELKNAVREVQSALRDNERLLETVLTAADSAVNDHAENEVVIGGSTNILEYPEYSDVEKARSVLRVLEDRETVAHLLGKSGTLEFNIKIGQENDVPEMRDCSVVSASYRIGDGEMGTIGIIGPTRMNYAKVISVLDYMGRSLSDILSGKHE